MALVTADRSGCGVPSRVAGSVISSSAVATASMRSIQLTDPPRLGSAHRHLRIGCLIRDS